MRRVWTDPRALDGLPRDRSDTVMTSLTRWLFAASLGGSMALPGQDFSIHQSRFSAGGGQSAGGGFVLRGSPGWPGAGGPLDGGGFTLIGGFSTRVGLVPAPGAPRLAIRQNPDGTLTLSWPPAPGWTLEQSGGPLPGAWTGLPHPPREQGPTVAVTVTPAARWLFFRLRKSD